MASRAEWSRSREGLLQSGNFDDLSEEKHSRTSSDLDDLDFLTHKDPKKKTSTSWLWKQIRGERGGPGGRPARIRRRRCCRVSNACWIVILILLGGLVLLSTSGAFWVYSATPKDGVRDLEGPSTEVLTVNLPGIAAMVSLAQRRCAKLMAAEL